MENTNLNNLASKFKSSVGLTRKRRSFVGTKINRGLASTRKSVVSARMKEKANARAAIELAEEKMRELRRAKLKATRNAKTAELKKIKEQENKAQANLNSLMNAFNKMNFGK
jgi:flagellar biosynthesis protein FliP